MTRTIVLSQWTGGTWYSMASVYCACGAVVKHLREDGFGTFLEGPTDGGLALWVDGEGVGVEVLYGDRRGRWWNGRKAIGARDLSYSALEFLVPGLPPRRLLAGLTQAVERVEEAVLCRAEVLTQDGFSTTPDHVRLLAGHAGSSR